MARLWTALKSAALALIGKKSTVTINSRHCREFAALEDIDLVVKRGENVGIIGLNGSGKSTLLQIIAGILQPTRGEVTVNGRLAALLELGSGFNPEFTGRENVYLNGTVLGLNRRQIDDRFDDIAAFADIGAFIDDPVKTYSSGMFVRLAFAVATHVSADILLIDEALTVGDIFFQQKCYARLNDLKERGVAIVLVSHGMNDVEQFCDRAYLLHRGRLHASGPSPKVVKHYYLLNQGKPSPPKFRKTSQLDEKPEPEKSHIPTEADIDLEGIEQVSDGSAKLTRFAICDGAREPSKRFYQGHKVVFQYEFTLTADIEVPLVGVVIFDKKGNIVHGKGTLEYGTELPSGFEAGQTLKFQHEIQLELAIGQYTLEVGFASMSLDEFKQAGQYNHGELNKHIHRHCHVTALGPIEVTFRSEANPVQLLHHGIANLPGRVEWLGTSAGK